MPFTAAIVNYINTTLREGCSLLTDGRFLGIASIIARKKTPTTPLEQLPGILNDNKEYTPVEPNDKYKLIVYHKILSNTYSFDKTNSYGDDYRIKCTTEMAMIVWGDAMKLGIAEELEAVIVFGMPQRLSRVLQNTLGLATCSITPVNSTLDRLPIFRQEYPQSEFFLKPNHQFFQIRYRIESSFDRACVQDLCGQPG